MNLNQVTIPSKDVKTAIDFYSKLGLKLIVEALPHYARFECPDGDATFSIHLVDNIREGEGAIIYFEEDQLDNYVKQLVKAGIIFDEMPEDRNWLWREAHLKDPDGNKLIVYHAGENRKNPPWRIDRK
jgi:catechol 2,3-dioxygenase-like lactoylglutathione lyase family enzyme